MQNESINDSLSDLKQMFQHRSQNKQNSKWEERKVFHCNVWIPLSRAASISFVKCASFPAKCGGDEFQLNKSTYKHTCCVDTQTKRTVYTEINLLCMHQSLVWSFQPCRALLIKILMKSHPIYVALQCKSTTSCLTGSSLSLPDLSPRTGQKAWLYILLFWYRGEQNLSGLSAFL